jgi:hypothetical protein
VDPLLGSLVYQLPGGITLAYDPHLGCTIFHWKGIIKDIFLGAQLETLDNIDVIYQRKTSFRPSKWPWKFRSRKIAKIVNFQKTILSQLEYVGGH